MLKGKISTSGQAAVSTKYDLGSDLNLIFLTGYDLATKGALCETPHPFAVGIDYKFKFLLLEIRINQKNFFFKFSSIDHYELCIYLCILI